MKRQLLALSILLGAGMLTAAGPVPLRITPRTATLGVPLTATLDLPDDETQLAGLPALGPFELLTPPRKEGNQLHLIFLPMRPGKHTFPPIPLHQGRSRQLSTAPIAIEVGEGVPADSRPAPLKGLTSKGEVSVSWPVALVPALLLCLAFAFGLRAKTSNRRRPPPSLEELSGEALLRALQLQLEASGQISDERWKPWAKRLEQLRFAPGERQEEAIRELLADFLRMTEGAL